MKGRLLIVDDERSMCEMLHEDLSERGCEVEWRTSADEAFALFMREPFDTVITDLKMPGLDGIAFCHRLAENRPDVPVIVITAFGSLSTAVEAIRAGAYDFVTKPVEMDMLAIAAERALNHRALREQVRFLREESGQWGYPLESSRKSATYWQ
jgi:two-component system, NtrC family, response regulator AtoC